jgi:hypothetical protein
VEQAEFDGEPIGLLALRNEEIDAAGVIVEATAAVGGLVVVNALGGEANLEDALRFVVLDERGAHDFSERAVGVASRCVHLPQAILRGDVTLGDEEVVLRGGVNVRHAVCVAANGDRRGQAGEMHVTVELGQSRFGSGAKPEHSD